METQAVEGMADLFSGQPSHREIDQEAGVREPHAGIGEPTAQCIFLSKAISCRAVTEGKEHSDHHCKKPMESNGKILATRIRYFLEKQWKKVEKPFPLVFWRKNITRVFVKEMPLKLINL